MDRFVLGITLGRWQANCWIIGDHDRGTAVVVDPGEGGSEQVPQLLDRLDVRCEGILLTHGHLDHLWAAPDLARALDAPVLLHPADRWLWDDPAAAFGAPKDALVAEFGLDWKPDDDCLRDVHNGERLTLAGTTYTVRHTPGHTPGHVVYVGHELQRAPVTFALADADAATDDVLFSGDLLFAGSVGRTDLAGGSDADMARSLASTVTALSDDTLVLCGHGPDTTIGQERTTNPFLARIGLPSR